MPGVQILFHSSGERVGGPNLPQRGFFVPAVRGAAVRCGDFSAGEGRSGRFRGRGRLRAEKEGRSGALRCVAGTFRRGKGGAEGAGCGRKKRGGAGRCGGNKGGKAEGRAGVRRGKQQTGGKRMEDGRWKRRLEAKKSGGRMSLSGFFYDKESADKPGRPGRSAAVLPPSGPPNCGPRRLGSWSSCRLRLRCLSAPPAICSGAR